MGINEDTVCARASREQWFAERDKARQALKAVELVQRKQLIATATGCSIEQANSAPTLESVIASNASKSKASAGNLALRALERLEKLEDDALITLGVAEVATKWTANASKAGGWDAEGRGGSGSTVVNIAFLSPPAHEDGAGRVVIDMEGRDSAGSAAEQP